MATIAYLAHNVRDPAVTRRMAMFRAGGAAVRLGGFYRGTPPPGDEKDPPLLLGETEDARLARRAASVARICAFSAGRVGRWAAGADAVVARNLEMLAIAARAVRRRPATRLIYECLDVHRLLAGDGTVSRALRAVEARLLAKVSLVLVSSPDFVEHHFARLSAAAPVRLVENKVLSLGAEAAPAVRPPRTAPGQPWRIGWFGMIRCERSLSILEQLAARSGGAVEVVIRGQPALAEIPDFHKRVAQAPHVSFHGPYRNPEDLAAIYGDVDFFWAIDLFEAGLNSEWLLPNRLYEGCLHGAVPIARAATMTGRRLAELGIGARLGDDLAGETQRLFAAMTSERLTGERARVAAVPAHHWLCTVADCRDLVDAIVGTSRAEHAA